MTDVQKPQQRYGNHGKVQHSDDEQEITIKPSVKKNQVSKAPQPVNNDEGYNSMEEFEKLEEE